MSEIDSSVLFTTTTTTTECFNATISTQMLCYNETFVVGMLSSDLIGLILSFGMKLHFEIKILFNSFLQGRNFANITCKNFCNIIKIQV